MNKKTKRMTEATFGQAAPTPTVQPARPSPEMLAILRQRDEAQGGNGGGMFTGPDTVGQAEIEAILDDPEALKEHLRQNELAGAPAGFVKVPSRVVFATELSPAARLVLMGLFAYDWKVNGKRKGYVYPAQGALARYLGLSKRTVQTAVRELETEGYIRVDRGGGRNQTNRYYLAALAQEGRE
jgi:hypothetical protein